MWLHAKDTALAIIKIIELKNKNEIYNISGNYEQSNYETVKKIIESYYGYYKTDVGESEIDINKLDTRLMTLN